MTSFWSYNYVIVTSYLRWGWAILRHFTNSDWLVVNLVVKMVYPSNLCIKKTTCVIQCCGSDIGTAWTKGTEPTNTAFVQSINLKYSAKTVIVKVSDVDIMTLSLCVILRNVNNRKNWSTVVAVNRCILAQWPDLYGYVIDVILDSVCNIRHVV